MARGNPASASLPRVIYRDCRDIFRIARMTPAWARQSGRPSHQVFITALKLLFSFRFTPNEIAGNGILASSHPLSTAQTKISKRELMKLQAALNPMEIEPLTHNKALLDMAIDGKAFPSPPTLAIFFNGFRGVIKDGPAPYDLSSWETALAAHLPEEFVVKPATGGHGAGLRFYRRLEGQVLECLQSGNHTTIRNLITLLNRDFFYTCYLFQKRLHNHSDLFDITQAKALQTIRVITLIRSNGEPEILITRWRLGAPEALIDNFQGGRNHSVVCQLDPLTGQIMEVICLGNDGRYTTLDDHPVTGHRLKGEFLPEWDRFRDVSLKAAKSLAPLRSIGWDVAITDEGPVVIEANSWWDPPNECVNIETVKNQLRTEVGQS